MILYKKIQLKTKGKKETAIVDAKCFMVCRVKICDLKTVKVIEFFRIHNPKN